MASVLASSSRIAVAGWTSTAAAARSATTGSRCRVKLPSLWEREVFVDARDICSEGAPGRAEYKQGNGRHRQLIASLMTFAFAGGGLSRPPRPISRLEVAVENS